jgi:hypothetical protein
VLAAPVVQVAGTALIDARAGIGGAGSAQGGNGGSGGIGRVRLAADQLTVEVGAGLWPPIGTNASGETFVTRFDPLIGIPSAPHAFTAGSSSEVIAVVLEDNDATPYEAGPGGLTLYLTTSSSTGTFRDAAGTTTITSIVVPEGSSTASFRYRDSLAGTFTLTVADEASGDDVGLTNKSVPVTVNPKPIAASTVTLRHSISPHVFRGVVKSSRAACRSGRKVVIKKVGGAQVAATTTNTDGSYKVRHRRGGAGRYVARAVRREAASVICSVATSPKLKVAR